MQILMEQKIHGDIPRGLPERLEKEGLKQLTKLSASAFQAQHFTNVKIHFFYIIHLSDYLH